MADEKGKTWYGEIEATITETIKENRKRDITAVKLQGVLLDIVDLLKGKWLFGGVVQPSSQVDITGDVPTFYIAFTEGTYTNFGNNEVADGEFALFMPNLNGNWDVHKWSIGALLDGKVNVKEGYDLSKNDYTDEDRDKVASLPDNVAGKSGDTFPEGNFASFDASGNLQNSGCNEGTFIKGVQKNGDDLTPNANGKVNVTVQDGITPHIDQTTKEWMIGDEHTGVDAEGKDAHQVYVASVPQGETPMTKTEWLASLKGEKGDNAVNPFKGIYGSNNKPTGTFAIGDYIYAPTSASGQIGNTIWKWNGTTWQDSGETPDMANAETFASDETLQQVAIDDSHLVNPVNTADATKPVLAQAEDVMQLKAKLEGVAATETKVELVTSVDGQNIYDGCYVNGTTGGYQTSGVNKIFILPVSRVKKVRFLAGVIPADSNVNIGYSFGTLISGDKPNSTLSNFTPKVFSMYDKYGTESTRKEYSLEVPEDVTWLCLTYWNNQVDGYFYCYTLNGETAITDGDIDKHYEKQVKITDTDILTSYIVENCYIDSTTGNWGAGSSGKNIHTKINIEGVEKFEAKGAAGGAGFAFLAKNNKPVDGEFSGAILLSNGTYRHNLSANEVATIVPPFNAKYLIVMRGISSSISTPSYLKFFYKKQLVGTLNDVAIPIELHAGRLSSTTGLIQEITGTTTASSDIMFRNYAYEKLIAFNPLYESIVSTDYNGAGTITYHCFAENGNAYLGATTNKDAMPVGTTHIRIGLGGFGSDQADKIIRFNLYCKLKDKEYHVLKSGGNQYFSTYNPYHRTFSFEVTKPHVFDADSENTIDYYADGVDSNGNLQRDWTQGVIILPKDYSNVGKPSKVIINCHGTTSFNFDKTSFDMDGAWGFLAKCGYCVIDCCTDTFYTNRTFNSGDVARASNYPTGNAWECYSELVKFVVDNFNVDPNAFYIAGKSAGGMNAISFANKFSNIKINAIGLMAPGIDVWMNMRVMYASGNNDFLAKIGCDNPQTTWGLGGGGGVGSAAAAQKTYVLQYKDLINLHNPLMTHISENFDKDFWVNELLDKGMFASRESGDTTPLDTNSELIAMVGESSIYMKSPLKIWHAIDDAAVPYTESKWFVQMCKNGGCYALLRTWPAGNGRHYFDSFVEHEDGGGSTYIPQLVSYTTKFNEVVQANPAYCELVDWFNRW